MAHVPSMDLFESKQEKKSDDVDDAVVPQAKPSDAWPILVYDELVEENIVEGSVCNRTLGAVPLRYNSYNNQSIRRATDQATTNVQPDIIVLD
jgi:hypothetical protein